MSTISGIRCLVVDQDIIYTGHIDGSIREWLKESLICYKEHKGHKSVITKIMSDKNYLYTTSNEGIIQIWEKEDLRNLKTIDAHQDDISGIYGEKNCFYTSSWDANIKMWSKKSFNCLKLFDPCQSAVFSMNVDESYIYAGVLLSKICIIGKQDGNIVATLDNRFLVGGFIQCIEIDKDYIYCGLNNGAICIWDKKKFELIGILSQHKSQIKGLFSLDDKLISLSSDGTIMFWIKKVFEPINRYKLDIGPILSSIRDVEYIYLGTLDLGVLKWAVSGEEDFFKLNDLF